MSLLPERQAAEEAMAQRYAEAIRSHDDTKETWMFWHDLNLEIATRWSWTALARIKARAWKIVEAAI